MFKEVKGDGLPVFGVDAADEVEEAFIVMGWEFFCEFGKVFCAFDNGSGGRLERIDVFTEVACEVVADPYALEAVGLVELAGGFDGLCEVFHDLGKVGGDFFGARGELVKFFG